MVRNNTFNIATCAILLALCACSTKQNIESENKAVYPITDDGFYVVQDGDTLSYISQHFGRSMETLLCWNRLSNKNILQVGQRIRVMPYKGKKANLCLNLPSTTNKVKKENTDNIKDKSEKRQISVQTNKPAYIGVQPIWPIKGTISKSFSDTNQKGIDITAKTGDSIKAVADGTVIYAGEEFKDHGKMIVLRHNHLLMTTYSNNHQLLVGVGKQVKKGQTIAKMGQGRDGQGLLHFEMMLNNHPINPTDYLPK